MSSWTTWSPWNTCCLTKVLYIISRRGGINKVFDKKEEGNYTKINNEEKLSVTKDRQLFAWRPALQRC